MLKACYVEEKAKAGASERKIEKKKQRKVTECEGERGRVVLSKLGGKERAWCFLFTVMHFTVFLIEMKLPKLKKLALAHHQVDRNEDGEEARGQDGLPHKTIAGV